ncbi:MAG: hypothetical protein IJJ03_04815 [Mogibacterium sp.]|nr:hypothetical protein [Mogibacterium sp.]MBQ6500247.1 hypothetical protein [Mogibacterium sp.]
MISRRFLATALIITLAMLLTLLTACAGGDETPGKEETDQNTESTENTVEDNDVRSITMKINDEEVNVIWEDNESADALAELVSESPLTIDMSMYGGFEQVGAIGTDLPSSDISITTEPGDIMLYTGNNIVVFYGSNSWSYTRLGHIENKSEEELRELLGKNDVKITLSAG